MATKTKNTNMIEIEGELLNSVSYATYYCRLPLFTTFKIFNVRMSNLFYNLKRKKGYLSIQNDLGFL